MRSSTLTTDTLYQHTAATFCHQANDDDFNTPLFSTDDLAQPGHSEEISIKALLGVSCYAGGLFSLAWWQLAHPSFLFLMLGTILIAMGAKLFLFPNESFTQRQPRLCQEYDSMVTLAEYINPHANLAANDDDHFQHHKQSKCTETTSKGLDFLLPFKLF